jgi:hypothetical protein
MDLLMNMPAPGTASMQLISLSADASVTARLNVRHGAVKLHVVLASLPNEATQSLPAASAGVVKRAASKTDAANAASCLTVEPHLKYAPNIKK